jgi:acyl carrier protein
VSRREDDREQRKDHLIRFLRRIQKPDRPIEAVDEHESLIESGLTDSLALLEIITYLETTYAIDFRERGVDPDELDAIGKILDLIERETA